MPLILTSEQAMLRDTVRDYMAERSPVSALRKLRDERDPLGYSRELWKGFAEMGFTGILVPEAHGGLGLGYVEAGVVMEEIGKNLVASPYLATAVAAATALVRGGGETQKGEWLPKIAAGDAVVTLAVDEGAKHDPAKTALEAKRSGNGFRLDGKKAFVLDGHVADLMIVAARTAGSAGETAGLTLFLVDPKSKGVSIERTVMVDSHNSARVELAGVEVDADAVLGEVDGGHALLEGVLSAGRAAVAAEETGLSDEAFGRTVEYLKTRKQFGRDIGEFQALQHRSAHLFSEIELAKACVIKALQTLDQSFDAAGPICSVAKAKAGQVATLAVQEAVQMHGGVGMTDELDIGLFMKRARVAQELWGDANFHAERLARMSGY
jgi:alkylation response protein AidB-like acyl-CoA dehydrogenase